MTITVIAARSKLHVKLLPLLSDRHRPPSGIRLVLMADAYEDGTRFNLGQRPHVGGNRVEV